MLILPRSCFLHVPKTGGSWGKKAVEAAGIDCLQFSPGGNQHARRCECPCPEKFMFAFVRHPLGFYRSYWQYKMTCGWDPHNAIDESCRSDDFHTFVTAVLTLMPGIYGRSLQDFVGSAGNPINFIGKYENLVEDLITALLLAEEQFDAAAIRAIPPFNVSNKTDFPGIFTPELEAAVLHSEASMIIRFGY